MALPSAINASTRQLSPHYQYEINGHHIPVLFPSVTRKLLSDKSIRSRRLGQNETHTNWAQFESRIELLHSHCDDGKKGLFFYFYFPKKGENNFLAHAKNPKRNPIYFAANSALFSFHPAIKAGLAREVTAKVVMQPNK